MKRTLLCVVAILCLTSGITFAMSQGGTGGKWPKNWPKELEPLRKQAWSWTDGLLAWASYDIPFKSREEFEAAWPHILKVKTKGAPITLMRGPHIRVDLKESKTAGVRIRVLGRDAPQMVTDPETGAIKHVSTPGVRPTAVELLLVVDRQIVDLNRIPLPPDTPIIDDRFKPTR
jgi:hypothetical protein